MKPNSENQYLFKDFTILYNNNIRMYIQGEGPIAIIIIESLSIVILTFLYFFYLFLGPVDIISYLVLSVILILIFLLITAVVAYLRDLTRDYFEIKEIQFITSELVVSEIKIEKIGEYSFTFLEDDLKYMYNNENKFHYYVGVDPLKIMYNRKYSFQILEHSGEFTVNSTDWKKGYESTLYIDISNFSVNKS